ncbi:ABC transporter permease [Paenibacillus rhizosphaerae]|uniref:Putative hemin transport system permease protein HrtB n=1 Tax=Paenibacillus rhizosphaerae TaxID=297318 RepID=A0A1R1F0U6_9BACL|nr:ABC transporter permease [Paenibacillus rhizosphaerae]OMF57709.1 ABC transporter permease [Paenibacillus rhizosphaerae]
MYLALREIRFAKARYTLIAAIMLLISFLVLFVTGLAQGLAYDNAASIQNMPATHFVLEQGSDHRFTRSQISGEKLEQTRSVVGETNAEPLGVQMTSVVLSGDIQKIDVALLAVNPKGWLAPDLTMGVAEKQETGGVVVDEKLAEHGVRLGSILVDQASGTRWTVTGFVKNESFSHAPAVFLSKEEWMGLHSLSSAQSGSGSAEGQAVYNAVAVKATEVQVSKLQSAVPNTEIIKKADAVSAIPGYKEEQGSLLMMIAFLFVISAFVLAVFFYVITIQKTSQFGILKAIGTRTAYLAGSVTLQVLLLSVFSLAVSIFLVKVLEMALPGTMPFQLGANMLALTCAAFIAMSLAGSLFSVWKVARIEALDAIGRAAA